MAELCRRYPIAPELAAEMLDQWVETGGLIRLAPADPEAECRWAEPENLAEVHRLSVAIRRRESVAVAPEVFADFLLRRQHLHPATRLEGPGGLEAALERLQGYAAAAEFWESEILPRRVQGYRAAWLDDLLAAGCWLWRAASDGRGRALGRVGSPRFRRRLALSIWTGAKCRRTSGRSLTFWPAGARASRPTWPGPRVWSPRGCAALSASLMLRGQVDKRPVRPAAPGGVRHDRCPGRGKSGSALAARTASARAGPARGRAEGRWALLEPPIEDEEDRRLAWLGVLLERYGILTRELAELDPWAPAWADLAPLLARAELRGELRRGYFVEGFSGVQYASDEAAEGLSRLAGSPAPAAEDILLAAADPANLYGSGAPLDIPLLDGGTAG